MIETVSKRTTMKRKVPVLRVAADVNANYLRLAEIPEVKDAIMEEAVIAIAEGMKARKREICLFMIANSEYNVMIGKNDWKITLEKAQNYFAELENYDKAIECRDLITKLK